LHNPAVGSKQFRLEDASDRRTFQVLVHYTITQVLGNYALQNDKSTLTYLLTSTV